MNDSNIYRKQKSNSAVNLLGYLLIISLLSPITKGNIHKLPKKVLTLQHCACASFKLDMD